MLGTVIFFLTVALANLKAFSDHAQLVPEETYWLESATNSLSSAVMRPTKGLINKMREFFVRVGLHVQYS